MKGLVLRSLLVGLATAAAIVGMPTAAKAAVTAQEGTAFTATVATPVCLASSPTIDWGDGTGISAATVGPDNAIQGTHTYRIAGTYKATASDICTQTQQTVSTPFTVTVNDAPLTLVGVPLTGTVGAAVSGVIAHLTDANPLSLSSDFTATIDWGDGTTAVGSVGPAAAGGYDIAASHGYASAGSYTVTIAITDPGGETSTTFTATIAAPVPPADPLRPHTTITDGPQNGAYVWTTAPVFSFTSTIAGSSFECMVDNGPFAPCASGRFIGPLSSGGHTFAVRAVSPTGLVDLLPATAYFYVGSPTTFKADGCQRAILPYPFYNLGCRTIIGTCPQFASCTITGTVTMTDADGDGRYFPFEGASVSLHPKPSGVFAQASCGNNVYRPDPNFGYYQQYVTTHGCQTQATQTFIGLGPKVSVSCTAFMSYVGDQYLGDPDKRLYTCAGHMTLAPTTPLAARLFARRFQVFVASFGVLKVTATLLKAPAATTVRRPIAHRTIQVQQPGVVSVPFSLTGAERALLSRHGSLRLRLREAFTPDGGTMTTRVTQFTLRSAPRVPTPRCPIARCPVVKHPGHA